MKNSNEKISENSLDCVRELERLMGEIFHNENLRTKLIKAHAKLPRVHSSRLVRGEKFSLEPFIRAISYSDSERIKKSLERVKQKKDPKGTHAAAVKEFCKKIQEFIDENEIKIPKIVRITREAKKIAKEDLNIENWSERLKEKLDKSKFIKDDKK